MSVQYIEYVHTYVCMHVYV